MARLQQASFPPEDSVLKVTAGADARFVWTIYDDGAAANITNDTVTCTVKDAAGVVKIATQTNAPGGHVTPAAGKTAFQFARASLVLTDPTVAEIWRYEVRWKPADADKEYEAASGPFIVRPGVGEGA